MGNDATNLKHHTFEMDRRDFENPYPDYDKSKQLLNADKSKINDEFGQRLHAEIERLLRKLEEGLEVELDERDYSVYTGTSGIALLHFLMYTKLDHGQNQRYLKSALQYIKDPLKHLKGRRESFLCGDAGPLAIGAALYSKLGQQDKCADCLNRLLGIHHNVSKLEYGIPDELLYGRVGYLYSLLFVQKHLGSEAVDPTIIQKVFKTIIRSGREFSGSQGSPAPLMFAWHEKKYLGAAHGLAGIFYVLMQVQDSCFNSDLRDFVKPSIQYLMTLQFPSGNCPSSIESSSGDKLLHWCHGAPGWIHMFIAAYKVFGEEKFLQAAVACSEAIWKRGILKKGYGICHGTAGNAYAFLAMFKLTNDQKYLYRACKFAEWCFDYGRHGCRRPDRPYSLFEGLAGTIYFLIDLLEPHSAAFPAFDV